VCASIDENVEYGSGRHDHSRVLLWLTLLVGFSIYIVLLFFYLRVKHMKVAKSLFWAVDTREIEGNTSNSEGFKVLHLFGYSESLRTMLLASVTMFHILPADAQRRSLTLKRLNIY